MNAITMNKSEIVNKLQLEIGDMKKRRQSTVYTYWNYSNRRQEYADTNKQFRMIKDLWKKQGFNFSKSKDYPLMAEAIGARKVTSHVWRNHAKTELNSASYTEALSMMMGYMNAGNETVTWEISI
tara:strand:+ start:756 stop:1130 length:375 start_codon:yes stop_codon:yes gene_type:complete